MRPYTDEQLAARADGELDATTAQALDAALATDPQLARRYARFTATRRLLRDSFSGVADEPVPERLLRALAVPAAAPRRRPRWQPLALAASLVIAVAAGFVALQAPRGPAIPGLPPDTGALAYVLEHTPSGEPAKLYVAGARYELLPLSTLKTADGRWCREFESAGDDGSVRAVGCRGSGHWQVQLPSAAPGAPQDVDEYRTAGAPGDEAFAGARRLGASEEAALLASGWKEAGKE